MSSMEQNRDYWVRFWTNNPMFENENPHSQVARTVNKIPIDSRDWLFQLSEIERILNLAPDDTLLDLCAGNGLIAKPLSEKCKSVTAVDISTVLLKKIDPEIYPSIKVIAGDVRGIQLPSDVFSKGVMYTALQHFAENEVIGIFETIRGALKQGGIFLVGDIPDIDRLFNFYNKPEWVAAYFDSLRNNTPAIGTWFKKEILLEMAKYVGFSQAIVLEQPSGLVNSHYRFDLLLTK